MEDQDENWLAEDIAAYIRCKSVRHVSERLIFTQGFPTAYRPGGTGRRRWKRSEIIAWWENQREKAA